MGALLPVQDPRDNLEKADRWTLSAFAQKNGIPVPDDSPAMITIALLRQKGITNLKYNAKPLGLQLGGDVPVPNDVEVPQVDPATDLMRQYQMVKPDYSTMKMNELRAECKKRKIKMDRRDNLESLRAKLSDSKNAD